MDLIDQAAVNNIQNNKMLAYFILTNLLTYEVCSEAARST